MSNQRILLGLLALAVVQIGAGELLSLFTAGYTGHETWQSTLFAFVAAFTGGWVARGRFVLPAMGFWFALWVVVSCIVYGIAASAGQASVASIIRVNWVAMALSGVATLTGAWIGQTLVIARSHKPVVAS